MGRHLPRRPVFPEGWIVPLLVIAIAVVVTRSVEDAGWLSLQSPLTVIALIGSAFGIVLAKLRIMDSLAHLFALVTGFGAAFVGVALFATELGPSLRDRLRPLGSMLLDWYMGGVEHPNAETYLVSFMMGIIVWLVAYLASWALFRRGWITLSVLLPGFLLLVNLGYAPEADQRYVIGVLVLTIALVARYHYFHRQRVWRAQSLSSASPLGARFLMIGLIFGVLATTAGWQSPAGLSQSALQPFAHEVSTQIQNAQSGASNWLEDRLGVPEGSSQTGGSYTAFNDSFSIGGELNLSDQPEVLVHGPEAPYLTAHRYDEYTGEGWNSTVEENFTRQGPDGRNYSPQMSFRAEQELLLSPGSTDARDRSQIEVEPLVDHGNLLLTSDTFLTSSVDTSVRLSWWQVEDQPFPVSMETADQLPPDLQRLGSQLFRTELTESDADPGPLPQSDSARQDIIEEQERLANRFLDVRWTADSNGAVETLYVTGQLPVYDDVEAVYARDGVSPNETYQVTGLESVASANQLANAPSDYPNWIEERYLQLPDTVTPRTVELTQEITADAVTPYEQASVIEAWLRANITYDESVPMISTDTDVVDSLLFDVQAGYCEHYATGMTVMLRSIGVPARVVTGYYPGDYDEEDDAFVYRQANAHAWVEAYFPGYGWIPFEPTSSQPLLDEREGEAGAEQAVPTPEPTMEPEESQEPEATASPVTDFSDDQALGAPEITPESDGGGMTGWVTGIAVALGATALAVAALWLAWTWKLRSLAPSSALFMRLTRLGRLIGIRPGPSMTPAEFGDSFSESQPAMRQYASRIVHVYELDQYGPDGADTERISAARSAWQALRRHLPSMVFRRNKR